MVVFPCLASVPLGASSTIISEPLANERIDLLIWAALSFLKGLRTTILFCGGGSFLPKYIQAMLPNASTNTAAAAIFNQVYLRAGKERTDVAAIILVYSTSLSR